MRESQVTKIVNAWDERDAASRAHGHDAPETNRANAVNWAIERNSSDEELRAAVRRRRDRG